MGTHEETVRSVTKSEMGEFINKDQLWEHMGGTVSSVTKSEIGEFIKKDKLWEHMGRNCK